MPVETKVIKIEKAPDTQLIVGHAGFIKTPEDLYEALVNAVPGIEAGIAFVEASGPCLVRTEGNSRELEEQAGKAALEIAAGHTFVIFFRKAYPINVKESIARVPEVARIYCATANSVQLIVADTPDGRAVLGAVDGSSAKGIENADDKSVRRDFLRKLGYKLK